MIERDKELVSDFQWALTMFEDAIVKREKAEAVLARCRSELAAVIDKATLRVRSAKPEGTE